jgi:hypothetical protein
MLDNWGIHLPHEFQIHAMHLIFFHHNWLVYLIAKTGSGKSAVPLTTGLMHNGITLMMIPLVRLRSNKVSKSTNKVIASKHTTLMSTGVLTLKF